MDNKLSELSKPVAWTDERGNLCTNRNKERGLESRYHQDYEKYTTPFYSQEYVSALLARVAELEKKETWRERQSVIDGLARSGEAWADIEEYMEKWDAEHLKTMKEQRNG